MRKNYTLGLLILVFGLLPCFSSFGQNPIANNDNFGGLFSCTAYLYYSILENDISTNGIDPNSIDLDPYSPGIQTNYSGFYLQDGIVICPFLLSASYTFSYTFKDNLGNISNVAIVTVDIFGFDFYSNTTITCDNPYGGVIPVSFSDFITQDVSTFKLYKNNVFVTQLTSSDNSTAFTGLSEGYYEVRAIFSCGPNEHYGYYNILYQNPFTGTSTSNYIDYNNNGVVDVGDVMNFQYTISNTSTCTLENVTVTNTNSIFNTSQPIPSMPPNTSNSTYSAYVPITQYNINQGSVTHQNQIKTTTLIDSNFSVDFTSPLSTTNGIRLNPFIDSNNNSIQDYYEQDYKKGTYSYQVNSGITHYIETSLPEIYLYETNPSNNYNLGYSLNSSNFFCESQNTLSTSQYNNINVPLNSGITTYNFPVVTSPCKDIAVYIIGNSLPRPGFEYINTIKIVNEGNQSSSGVINFIKNPTATLISTNVSATVTPTGFTYNYYLNAGSILYIQVIMQVPTIPTVQLGQFLTNSVTVTTNETNILNNTASINQPIVGSYDPNDKQESHGGKILHSNFTANDYLNYMIRFENTGTANAINIKVTDVLDAKLDETSIRMVDATNPYILDRVGSNLNWYFNNVNLPPSSPASTTIGHGYIVFQVKPKPGFAIGDVIPNTANIYFDFNPAIVTNTCTTEFVSTLANENFTFNNFKSFPNPVKNTLTISNASPIETIEISSLLGQKMFSKRVNDIQTEINLSQLSNGIYFVKVTSQGNEKTIKIVKE